MSGEHVIGPVSLIPPGEGRTFNLDGVKVAVFHTRNGKLFATQAQCPHRGGPLADGLTDEISVVCPLHDRLYDLRTGYGIGNECNIMTYPIRVSPDGMVMVMASPMSAMATTR